MTRAFEAGTLLFTDESGNDGEALQVLAGIAGTPADLAALEERLRASLKRHGVRELKWAGVRSRKERHRAAREFLALASEEAAAGRIWIDVIVLEPGAARRAHAHLSGRERWLLLYQGLLRRSKRRGPRRSRWALMPDQRTGMPWKRLGRLAGLEAVVELSSSETALIQLADLLAGLVRFSRERREGAAERARFKRQELLDEFTAMRMEYRLWPIKNLNGVRRAKKTQARD